MLTKERLPLIVFYLRQVAIELVNHPIRTHEDVAFLTHDGVVVCLIAVVRVVQLVHFIILFAYAATAQVVVERVWVIIVGVAVIQFVRAQAASETVSARTLRRRRSKSSMLDSAHHRLKQAIDRTFVKLQQVEVLLSVFHRASLTGITDAIFPIDHYAHNLKP